MPKITSQPTSEADDAAEVGEVQDAKTAKHLRPFLFHGVNFESTEEQAVADCFVCGREGKMSVDSGTGKWHCFVCSESGNVFTFLRKLHELSEKATISKDHQALAEERRLLYPETLLCWGVCRSSLTGEWLLPGFSADSKLVQLYRWVTCGDGKRKLLATPTLGHGIFRPSGKVVKGSKLRIAEGPWDGMAAWELLRVLKSVDGPFTKGRLVQTGNVAVSLLGDGQVIAVPGCGHFSESWLPLLEGRPVELLYDSDHPKEHPPGSGKTFMPGWDGMRKVCELASRAPKPPTSVSVIHWGDEVHVGYDPNTPSGFDIRDAVKDGDTLPERAALLGPLLARIGPMPQNWVGGRGIEAKKNGSVEIDCIECESWKELTDQWRKPMKWIDGLNKALAVMLASIVSTKAIGSQLWVRILSPASTGKSVLCEALSVNKRYIKAVSTLTGIHSGYRETRDTGEDNSLVAQLYDKTMVVKDADPLLQAENKGKILSDLRDIYDRTSRTHFKNKASKDYTGVNLTIIICGTNSLHALDQSELGERFLTCQIMEKIDEDMEDEILLRVAKRAGRGMSQEANGTIESQNDPEMTLAMQMTGGYVGWLRTNARELLAEVQMSDEQYYMCGRLGKFIAFMRARPSVKQEETTEREFGARLTEQMVRLTQALTVVLNKTIVDDEVMDFVLSVALDSSAGISLRTTRILQETGTLGMSLRAIAMRTGQGDDKCKKFLGFMREIAVIEWYEQKTVNGLGKHIKWRLTARFAKLWKEVFRIENPPTF